jgi:hypothetical protein
MSANAVHVSAARSVHRPYSGRPQPLALDPDQREIAAGRAQRHVALVEHGHARPGRGHAPRDRGADEAAADHGDVEFTGIQGLEM